MASLPFLRTSRALWRRRELYRKSKLDGYTRKHDKPSIEKWSKLYTEAHKERVNHDREIAILRRPRAQHASNKGITAITRFEGFVDHVYLDAVDVPTIGYGHVVQHGEQFPSSISMRTARALLQKDLATRYEPYVRSLVKVRLTQGEFDALTSFVYNLGPGALAGSTLLRKLNAGDHRGAADEFLKWNRAGGRILPGLTARRRAERDLFLS